MVERAKGASKSPLVVFFTVIFMMPLTIMAQKEQRKSTFERKEIRNQINRSVRPEIRNMKAFLEGEKGSLTKVNSIHDLLKQVERKRQKQLKKSGRSVAKQPASLTRLDALKLRMRGYTRAEIKKLRKQEGIDPARLMLKSQMALSPSEKLILSETVVIAEVLEKRNTLQPKDGYRSSVVLDVNEVLTGEVPSDRIVLRRLSGRAQDGRRVTVSHDFRGKIGSEYVFYISNTKYRYRIRHPLEFQSKKVNSSVDDRNTSNKYIREYKSIKTNALKNSTLKRMKNISKELNRVE